MVSAGAVLSRMACFFLRCFVWEMEAIRSTRNSIELDKVVSPMGDHIGYENNGVLIKLEGDNNE